MEGHTPMPHVHLDLTEGIWEGAPVHPDESPFSRLLSTVFIEGVPHHLEAIQVVHIPPDDEQEWETQEGTTPGTDDLLARYHEVAGGDGPFLTVKLGGAEYVLALTPFCD